MVKRLKNKIIRGDQNRPRLSVSRSVKNIQAQIIDDEKHATLVGVSSVSIKEAKNGNIEAAKLVGAELAKKATKLGITKVVFDRRDKLFHGRIKALADSARENGLEF